MHTTLEPRGIEPRFAECDSAHITERQLIESFLGEVCPCCGREKRRRALVCSPCFEKIDEDCDDREWRDWMRRGEECVRGYTFVPDGGYIPALCRLARGDVLILPVDDRPRDLPGQAYLFAEVPAPRQRCAIGGGR